MQALIYVQSCTTVRILTVKINVLIALFQLSTGEVWVQYNDGSQMVIQSSVTSIKYTDSKGAITR